jgi:histidinol-phosphatase
MADRMTLDRYLAADLLVETKPDLTPVSEADTAVEHAIRERLAAAVPADAVVGEEFGASTTPEGTRRWILDPIDGTKNYVRGIPVWATLIALEDEGELTVGVVSAPALHRRWWAARGRGAFVVDGLSEEPRQIHCSGVRQLADAQLCVSGLNGWETRPEVFLALQSACWRTRGFGDFWGYMLVAEGAADICCEAVVSLWDLAAPQMVLEEAGGRFTDLGGEHRADGGDALATNSWLHEAALQIVRR